MRNLKFFGLMFAALFITGIGVGIVGAWIGDADKGPVGLLIGGIVTAIVGLGLFALGLRYKPEATEDAGAMDMVLGDMSDPVQRNIMIRIIIASAIHGVLLMRFATFDQPTATLGDGIEGREWIAVLVYAAFAATMLWIVVECILFHNIDEFWKRVALVPAALAGVILLLAVVLWSVAEELFGAPEARFWVYYALYYFSIVGLLFGKWKWDTRQGRG